MFRPSKCLALAQGCFKIQETFIARCESALSSKAGPPSKFDVVIVGAGCMGSMTAFWLKKKAPTLRILIIDRDLSYKTASTVLSCGGVRQQFTLKENVQLSCFGAEFVQNTKQYLGKDVDFQFKTNGYLMLGSEKGAKFLEENHQTSVANGGNNELLSPTEIKERFPWLSTCGIDVGCLGKQIEGWLDPWILLSAVKNAAKDLGVCYMEAVPCEFSYRTVKNDLPNNLFGTNDEIVPNEERVLKDIVIKTTAGELKKIEFKHCVLTTGCETGQVTKELLGIDRSNSGALKYEIPIERRKRYVYVVECTTNDVDQPIWCPMVIDKSGFYLRKEETANNFVTGRSPTKEDEPQTDNLEVDYEYFDEKLWPMIAHRIPCFEAAKVKSGWAGFYDYNYFDKNGIIGRHPAYRNMIVAAGFSGHGLQQSPGVGRGVAELMLHGNFQTIDLKCFGFERIIKNEPLVEREII